MIFPGKVIIRKFLPEDSDRILEIEYASIGADSLVMRKLI
jgi:hypothetical protein